MYSESAAVAVERCWFDRMVGTWEEIDWKTQLDPEEWDYAVELLGRLYYSYIVVE